MVAERLVAQVAGEALGSEVPARKSREMAMATHPVMAKPKHPVTPHSTLELRCMRRKSYSG